MPDKKTRLKARLNPHEERLDNSLQGKSLQRASLETPPTTLTPHEWEQWYRDHGVPRSHRQRAPRPRGWKRWLWWK